jgi:hypothetical protein
MGNSGSREADYESESESEDEAEAQRRLQMEAMNEVQVQAELDDLPPAGGARDYAVTIRAELAANHADVRCDRCGTL